MNRIKTEKQCIVAGPAQFFGFTTDGNVYVWGNNEWGQLGVGLIGPIITIPLLLKNPNGDSDKWERIVPGNNSSIGFTQNGHVYVWGWGHNGQLGLGDECGEGINHYTPTLLKPPKDTQKWKDIIAGDSHYFGIATTKTGEERVYSWGNNENKQLGFWRTFAYYEVRPQLVNPPDPLDPWKEIITGHYRSYGLTQSGKLYVWGRIFEKDGFGFFSNNVFINLKTPTNEKWENIISRGCWAFGITQSKSVYIWKLSYYALYDPELFQRPILMNNFNWREIYTRRHFPNVGIAQIENILLKPRILDDKWERVVITGAFSIAHSNNGDVYKLSVLESCYDRPQLIKPPMGKRWRTNDWPRKRILFIARLKEPSTMFFHNNLPLDIFKLILICVFS